MSKAETQTPAGGWDGARSPLHHVGLDNPGSTRAAGAGIDLREKKLLGHLVLRGNPENTLFLQSAEAVLGEPLPLRPCSSTDTGSALVLWLRPDEWLIIVEGGRETALETQLRNSIKVHFSVVDVSGGQTLLELSGTNAVQVMQKSTTYDVHLERFPVGKTISTAFAKTGAVIRRQGEDCFQLIVRRSFADYVWLWLQQASEEYGLTTSG